MKSRNGLILLIAIFPFFINGVVNSYIYTNPLLYWSFEFLYWIIIPLSCLYVFLKSPDNNLQQLGFSKSIFGKENIPAIILVGGLIFAVDYIAYHYVVNWAASVLPNKGLFSYETMVPDSGLKKIAIAIYFGLSAGFVEETFFRGMFYKLIPKPILYVLISSTLFGLMHWETGVGNILATFMFGLAFSIIYLKIKNIWPLIIAHTFTDILWFL